MNRIIVLVALAITSLSGVAFAGTGLAGDITIETEPFVATKSREQVKAELADAIRTGDILAHGESSYQLNEVNPNRYPPAYMAAGKTREQVKAELAEAIRTGDILAGGESSLKLNELYPWTYQGVDRTLAGDGLRRLAQRRIFPTTN
ncbi:MAG: hypothetical protein JWQ76_4826 [Ramlibacter sp.]|nr:hypothetical protein [Ramlibacter sp.]